MLMIRGIIKIFKNNVVIVIGIFVVCFIFYFLLPEEWARESDVSIIIGVIGLLHGLLIAFFINDLWNRVEKIKENVAIEVSGLQTYFLLAEVLSTNPKHEKWAEQQRELIDQYLIEFLKIEWIDYGKTDIVFNKIIYSLRTLPELETTKEQAIYREMLDVLNDITTARENLFMHSQNRLTILEWLIIAILAMILLISLIYCRIDSLIANILMATLSGTIFALLIFIKDLNDLTRGAEIISLEPYETIFDVIHKPRFYIQKDILKGRVKLPKNKQYRIEGEQVKLSAI